MFVRRNPIAAYSEVGVETSVASASPHKLILLLFEGAKAALYTARLNMANGDIPAKGASISKAIDIINNGLKASLDLEAGGSLAEQLSALYEYMVDRLLFANLKNEVAPLDEVIELLGQIHSAWEEIADRPEVTGFVPRDLP